ALFASIKMNGDIVCILLGPHGDPNFVSEILDGMRESVLDQWQLEFPHYVRKDLDFVFDYVLMGSTRLILNWLQDSKGIPASQFARQIERLGHHALLAIGDF
ncbi:MAG: TetR-like C-terminal domain-containing protein, partial [Faecousia sp.]